MIAAWRRGLDAAIRAAESDIADRGQVTGHGDLSTGISVVIPSYRGQDHIMRCLESLAMQTLHANLFEVIVIMNGPVDDTLEVVADFRERHPAINVRTVRLAASGASRARNAGIIAASREYITFIDDDDYVSPSMLEVLLRYARPRVIAIAQMLDVQPDGLISDSYLSAAIRKFAGKPTHPADIPSATSANAAKAVSTLLVRGLRYDEALDSGEDVVFWTTVAVTGNVVFHACSEDEKAVYYRVVRENSVSRQGLTFDFSVRQRLDVIEALERLASRSTGELRGLVQDRINAQSEFIGNYLRQFPAEHPQVVHALDRASVFNLQYERVNRMDARGLVIGFAFPPYADTSAVVMAKRVRALGQVVDVVQNSMDRIRAVDPSLRRISGPYVARSASLATPSFFADWGSVEAFAATGMETVDQWRRSGRRYDWVYSRAQFAASHFLAAAVKVSQRSINWIAEFSDPMSRDVQNQERGTPIVRGALISKLVDGLRSAGLKPPETDNFFVWCEEIAYALADRLIFTNESQLEFMLGYCSSPALAKLAREKAVVSPQPTLPSEFYGMTNYDYALDPATTHLAYFGNFYVTRGLTDLLSAIRNLGSAESRDVRLHVFTNSPQELMQAASALGVADLVITQPYLPYLEFLNLTTKFDCLIVNDAATASSHGRNPYLPSKWADYRGSGTAVWGLLEPGSPLSTEPLDFVSPVGDHVAATTVLRRIVESKRSGTALASDRPREVPVTDLSAIQLKDDSMRVPTLRRPLRRRRTTQDVLPQPAGPAAGPAATASGRTPRVLVGRDYLPLTNDMYWTDCDLVPGETYRVRTLVEGTPSTADRAAVMCFDAAGGGTGLSTSDTSLPPLLALRTGPGLWRTDRLITVERASRRFGLRGYGNRGDSTLKTLTVERIDDSKPTEFFMSFDTEALRGRASGDWIDRLVWGKVDGGEYGIRRICRVLAEYKIKANFMIDYSSCSREGDEKLAEIIDYLRGEGHELHLHSHPEQLWAPWGMTNAQSVRFDKMSYGMSRRLLDYVARKHLEFVGEEPRVFRTGGLFLNDNLIHAAQAAGIPVLSNVRNNVVGDPRIFGDAADARELYRWDNGVEEFPIDFALDPLSEPLDYYLGKFNELARRKNNERTFNMLMHSWSLLKLSDKGHYEIYEPAHEERLHVLCQHVTKHGTALGYNEFLDRPRLPLPAVPIIHIRTDDSDKAEYTGSADIVACNICDMSFSLAKTGHGYCPACGAGIRERQVAQAFGEYGNVFDGREVLTYDMPGLLDWDILNGAATVTERESPDDLSTVGDESMDCVVALYPTEQSSDAASLVATATRVLRRGGVLIGCPELLPDATTTTGAGQLSDAFDVSPLPALDPVTGQTTTLFLAYRR
jgi:glycosyltransferase involved in cell wall biosynthesis